MPLMLSPGEGSRSDGRRLNGAGGVEVTLDDDDMDEMPEVSEDAECCDE